MTSVQLFSAQQYRTAWPRAHTGHAAGCTEVAPGADKQTDQWEDTAQTPRGSAQSSAAVARHVVDMGQLHVYHWAPKQNRKGYKGCCDRQSLGNHAAHMPADRALCQPGRGGQAAGNTLIPFQGSTLSPTLGWRCSLSTYSEHKASPLAAADSITAHLALLHTLQSRHIRHFCQPRLHCAAGCTVTKAGCPAAPGAASTPLASNAANRLAEHPCHICGGCMAVSSSFAAARAPLHSQNVAHQKHGPLPWQHSV
jgi:hypothetical protein